MAQQIRVLAFNSGSLSQILRTHVLEWRNSRRLSSDLCTHTVAWCGIDTFKTSSVPFGVSMSLLTDHMGFCFCYRMASSLDTGVLKRVGIDPNLCSATHSCSHRRQMTSESRINILTSAPVWNRQFRKHQTTMGKMTVLYIGELEFKNAHFIQTHLVTRLRG